MLLYCCSIRLLSGHYLKQETPRTVSWTVRSTTDPRRKTACCLPLCKRGQSETWEKSARNQCCATQSQMQRHHKSAILHQWWFLLGIHTFTSSILFEQYAACDRVDLLDTAYLSLVVLVHATIHGSSASPEIQQIHAAATLWNTAACGQALSNRWERQVLSGNRWEKKLQGPCVCMHSSPANVAPTVVWIKLWTRTFRPRRKTCM